LLNYPVNTQSLLSPLNSLFALFGKGLGVYILDKNTHLGLATADFSGATEREVEGSGPSSMSICQNTKLYRYMCEDLFNLSMHFINNIAHFLQSHKHVMYIYHCM